MKVKADFKVSFWATKRLFSRPNRFAFFKPSRLVKWLHESTPTPLDRLTFLHGCGQCCKKHDCGDGKPESLSICVPCKVAACSSDSKDTSATRSIHVEQHALMPLEFFFPKMLRPMLWDVGKPLDHGMKGTQAGGNKTCR